MFAAVDRWIERVAAGVALVGGLGLIFAVAVTCLSVVLKALRRSLDSFFGGFFETMPWGGLRPVLGEEELVSYAVGFALFSALPWVMLKKGHIRIDLLEPYFGGRLNRWLDVAGDLALLLIAYLIMTQQWYLIIKKARRSQEPLLDLLFAGDWAQALGRVRVRDESQILGLKLWPMHVVAEVCVILFFITAAFCCVRSARALIRPTGELGLDRTTKTGEGRRA